MPLCRNLCWPSQPAYALPSIPTADQRKRDAELRAASDPVAWRVRGPTMQLGKALHQREPDTALDIGSPMTPPTYANCGLPGT